MATYIRFEQGRQDQSSEDYGPFDHVQLIYTEMVVRMGGEDKEGWACYDGEEWVAPDGQYYSSVVIFHH